MSKVAIDSEVVIQELQAENDFLRNRLLLSGQALKDLEGERDQLSAQIAAFAKQGADNG